MADEKNSRSKLAKLISWADVKLLFLRNRVKYRLIGKINPSVLLIPVFLAASVLIFLAQRSWFGLPPIPESSAELFYGIGTVTGAMLAIVFAFSSQLVSRAAEALPTRYFRLFARDTKLDLCYIAIGLVTVMQFVLGVISLNREGEVNTFLVRVGVWLLLVTIILLYVTYVRLIKLISHEYLVTWLAKYHKSQIDEISYNATRLARATQRGYKNLSEEDKLIIEGNMYETLQNQTNALTENLDGIIELYFIYKKNGDEYAARNVLSVASGLIMAYTLSRQSNSSLKANLKAGLTRESSLSAFLQTSFEKMKIIWDTALAENDVFAIRKYLRDVQGIVRVSLMVNHVKYPTDNPAFYTAYYNFSLLVKESIKSKNVDALFEIASVLEQITEIAVTKKHYVDALNSILDDLRDICVATAMDDEMSAVMHNVIKNIVTICRRILTQDDIDDHRLKKMQEVIPMCLALAAIKGKNVLADIAVTNFGDNIFAIVTHDMDEPPTKQQVRKIIQTSKFVISVLQKLATIANGSRLETQSFNRAIMIMAHTLTKILNDNLATEQQAQDIRWILNDLAKLPSSFPEPEKMIRFNDVDDYIDRLIQAAIVSAQNNQIDVATSIFNSIYDYLQKMLNDEKSKVELYEILHAVNDIKLIGAAARKLRKQKLQQHVAKKIRKFEADYHAKYYPKYPQGYDQNTLYNPPPTILRQERENDYFGYHGSGLPSYFHDAKALFLETYTQDDIDNFEDYIWQ